MTSIKSISLAVVVALGLTACGSSSSSSDNDIEEGELTLSEIKNLPNLGSDYVYEGWIIVDDAPISTGIFTVLDDENTLSQSTFNVDKYDLENATKFVLSIEPAEDSDPLPSATKILVSEFSGTGVATIDGVITTDAGTTFEDVAGKYILATPTDNDTNATNNDEAGVWWLDPSSGTPVAGLELPTLSDGWRYEGWAVIDGMPVSTGTFSSVSGFDNANTFSGAGTGPAFPGEDFLNPNADNNFSTPVDLRGKTIVISVEPYPDNSTSPFSIKPLVHDISTSIVLGGEGVTSMTSNGDNTNPSMEISR